MSDNRLTFERFPPIGSTRSFAISTSRPIRRSILPLSDAWPSSAMPTRCCGAGPKFGNEIRIDATLEDLKQQRSVPLKAQAPNQSGLFAAMSELAQSIRDNLALSADVIAELKKTSMKPSTQSLEALRDYNEGLQFARQGNHSEALKKLQGGHRVRQGVRSRVFKAGADVRESGVRQGSRAVLTPGSGPERTTFRLRRDTSSLPTTPAS